MALTPNNFLRSKLQRELKDGTNIRFARSCQVTPNFIRRLGLEEELQGHGGCVNCLTWNEKGSLLASGSDDVQVIVWDPFRHKKLATIRTGHSGNIFSVKFLPQSCDNIVVSGAADCKIRVHDVNMREILHVFGCHAGRVKRLAIVPDQPHLFWSASEDGTIMQFDLRNPEMCKSDQPRNILVNLNEHIGPHAEAKCLAMSALRPELLAVGANDPYVRVYDRRMLHCRSVVFPNDVSSRIFNMRSSSPTELNSSSSPSSDFVPDNKRLPPGCVQYYVAGHLPQKQQDYRKKYRTLASTYMTFGPDGKELLVNLGGEQIYLFDVISRRRPKRYDIDNQPSSHSHDENKGDAVQKSSNGLSRKCVDVNSNGFTNGVTKHIANTALESSASTKLATSKKNRYYGRPLPPAVEAIKKRANEVFEMQKYGEAICLYNQAISMAPNLPILYGNRAAAYLKRSWDGDVYAALRDCYSAINLDDSHIKAHFRLAKCLFELSWPEEALDCLQFFKSRFPDYAASPNCEALEKEIRAAIFSKTEHEAGDAGGGAHGTSSSASHGHGSSQWMDSTADTTSFQETTWRNGAYDYEQRFCGHCNTTTDIKEANFFGSNGQYIVAGSDDGSFFIWDKSTTNIVRVLRGDESIVNCLEPHPTACLLATSGIDPVVRLWSPRPEDGKRNDREVANSDDAASANQKRMNADPLEVMLINMGYRLSASGFEADEEAEREGESPVTCRPS